MYTGDLIHTMIVCQSHCAVRGDFLLQHYSSDTKAKSQTVNRHIMA